MRAISINPNTGKCEYIDIHMEANTLFTFFSSILIDENYTIKNHTIYTDSNALEEEKKPYFIAEQLVLGDALILGRKNDEDRDSSLDLKELEQSLSFVVPEFYTKVLKLISSSGVNLYKPFYVQKDGQEIALNIEWVLATFNIADERTKEYFIVEIQKAVDSNAVQTTLEKMAQLAINVA
jgi:hypothetical protein